MAKSYLRQVESKNRQLASARTEVSNRLRDANTADAKVRTAEEKLRDAEASERAAQKRKDENKQNETRIASKSNRKAASGLLANAMSARKSELSSSAPPMKPPGNASSLGLPPARLSSSRSFLPPSGVQRRRRSRCFFSPPVRRTSHPYASIERPARSKGGFGPLIIARRSTSKPGWRGNCPI